MQWAFLLGILHATINRNIEEVAQMQTNNQSQSIRRVALITGASRGLGQVLAGFLAGQGFHLILTARGAEELAALAESLRQPAPGVDAIPGDVADPAHRRRLVDAARRLGRLDLLINNASTLGVTPLPPLADYPQEAFEQVLEVNLLAPLALVQEALPVLRNARGLVVNLSSDAAQGGYPGWGAYGASKAALDLVSKTLAAELGDDGVGVVSVDPGDMRTAMHQAAFPGEDISDRPLPEITLPFWAWLLAQEPLNISGQRFQAQAEVWSVQGA
jgi:NAD(P)-dependent dehydrogenase (short-subunit alcohol dehydrogenase family)